MGRRGIHRQSSSLTHRLSRVDELRRFQARLSRELGRHLVFGAGPPPGQMGLRGRPHWPTSLVTLVTSANEEAQCHRLPLLCGPGLDRIQKKLKNTEGGEGRRLPPLALRWPQQPQCSSNCAAADEQCVRLIFTSI